MTTEEKTEAVLQFICEEIEDKYRPPSLREIANHFDFASTNSVRYHLNILIAQGKIKRDRIVSRGIRLVSP